MNNFGSGGAPGIRLLIFDLDGTLIDSEADLALSMNATLRRFGRAVLPEEVIASYVGHGVLVLVRRAFGAEASEELVEQAAAYFLNYYRNHMLDHTAPYAGVREALDDLRPRRMAVLTNKPVNFSRQIIAGLQLDGYFSFVYGGNSFEQKKPDPVGILRLMADTGVPAEATLMIGDSDTDIQTGRNAGVWTCGVTYGIGSHTLTSAPPDLLLGDLRELKPALAKNGAGGSAGASKSGRLASSPPAKS